MYKSKNAPSESILTHYLPRLRKCQYLQKFCKLVEVCQPPFALFAIGVCNYGQTQRRLNSHTKYNAVIVYCLKRIMNCAVCTTLSQILQFLMSSFLNLKKFFYLKSNYRKVASSRLSRLVAHFHIFRLLVTRRYFKMNSFRQTVHFFPILIN